MKASGIVRRIDDFGRVIIPKEIRFKLGIKDGDPLEIFVDGNESVTFKKYVCEGTCVICGDDTENSVLDRFICTDCIDKIKG